MIDWWWDHIDTTERYKLWHPTDHVSFEWLISPAEHGHVGAVHRVQEFFNGIPETPATIDIRWADAKGIPTDVIVASESEDSPGPLMHEYEAAPFGTRMRSHYHLPAETPEFIVKALYEHNKQEMQNFTSFLPELYHAETQG